MVYYSVYCCSANCWAMDLTSLVYWVRPVKVVHLSFAELVPWHLEQAIPLTATLMDSALDDEVKIKR